MRRARSGSPRMFEPLVELVVYEATSLCWSLGRARKLTVSLFAYKAAPCSLFTLLFQLLRHLSRDGREYLTLLQEETSALAGQHWSVILL